MKSTFVIATMLGVLFIELSGDASCQIQDDILNEAVFTFEYGRVLQATVVGRYVNDTLYLPLLDLLNRLEINYKYDPISKKVTGTFSNEKLGFTIDFDRMMGSSNSEDFTVKKTEFIKGELEFYVHPSLLKKAFDINTGIRFKDLSVWLQSGYAFPVLEKAERSYRFAQMQKSEFNLDAPLIGGFKSSIVDGGVIGYSVSAMQNATQRSMQYSSQIGMRFLGGDLDFSGMGGYDFKTRINTFARNYHWSFVLGENPILRQVQAGLLYSRGVRPRSYEGVTLTNEPPAYRTYADEYLFEGETEPGWDVELSGGNEFNEATRADKQGKYTFRFPLRYGQTSFTIKEYGPKGRYRERTHTISLPQSSLPAGEVNYAFSGGRDYLTHEYIGDGSLKAGLTSWLTLGAGANYVHKDESSRPVPYGLLSMRLGRSNTLTFDVVPKNYYRAGFNLFLSSSMNFDLAYSRFENPLYSLSGRDGDRIEALINLGQLPFLPVGLNINVVRNFSGATEDYLLNSSMYLNVFGLSLFSRYSGSLQGRDFSNARHNISTSLITSLHGMGGIAGLLFDDLTLNTTAHYDITQRKLTSVMGTMTKRIFTTSSLYCTLNKEMISNTFSVNFGITLQLPFIQFQSSASSQGSMFSTSQGIQGTVAFDSDNMRLSFDQRNWAGSGGVTLRPFVDYNGNGSYDNDELLIKNLQFRIEHGALQEKTNDGAIRLINVMPYLPMVTSIDEKSMKNPLYVPSVKKFSFVAEPNFFKSIEIPFFVSGTLEGSVQMGSKGLGGARVQFVSADSSIRSSVLTFSDGSYTISGLKPGNYTLRVDSTQLAMLRASTEPTSLDVRVQATRDGDYIEGINFIIKTGEQKKSAPSDTIIAATPQKQSDTTLLASIDQRDLTRGEPMQPQNAYIQNTDTQKEQPQNTQIKNGLPKPDSASLALNEARIPVPEKNESLTSKHTFPLYTANLEDRSALISYLDSLALHLFAHTQLNVTVRGYSDNFGRTSAEIASSEERAKFVAEHLSKKGIEPSRIQTEARGRKNPIATNASEEGRMKNKRVEIEVVEKKHQ